MKLGSLLGSLLGLSIGSGPTSIAPDSNWRTSDDLLESVNQPSKELDKICFAAVRVAGISHGTH